MNKKSDLNEINNDEASSVLPVDGSRDAGPFYHGTKAGLKK